MAMKTLQALRLTHKRPLRRDKRGELYITSIEKAKLRPIDLGWRGDAGILTRGRVLGVVTGLVPFLELRTVHVPDRLTQAFAPTRAEILTQIPWKYRSRTRGFALLLGTRRRVYQGSEVWDSVSILLFCAPHHLQSKVRNKGSLTKVIAAHLRKRHPRKAA